MGGPFHEAFPIYPSGGFAVASLRECHDATRLHHPPQSGEQP